MLTPTPCRLPIKCFDPFTPASPFPGTSACENPTLAQEVPDSFAAAAAHHSSLEPPQTSDEEERFAVLPAPYDDNPDACPFVHRGWHAMRKRVMRALLATEQTEQRLHRFWHCGEDIWVYQHDVTGEIATRHNHCMDRFCLPCGRCRSAKIAGALQGLIGKMSPLFMTFTVRGQPGDRLAALVDRLMVAWKALRATPLWKSKIRGGAAMLEIKYTKGQGGHWHPHLHVIADGDYIEVGWLSQLWLGLTGDSTRLHVTRVKDLGHVLQYVTKYASKPLDMSFVAVPKLLQEAIRTLKGRRLCACFGSWYGTPLNEEIPDEESPVLTQWSCLGSYRALDDAAARGSAKAKLVLELVERLYALESRRHVRGGVASKASRSAGPAPP